MKKTKTSKRNLKKIFAFITISTLIYLILSYFELINAQTINLQGNDYHYNVITLSSIIAGFLFTGISILISAISKQRIERLWNVGHLDLLYYSSFAGIFFCGVAIIISLILLVMNIENVLSGYLCLVETYMIFEGVAMFFVCVKELFYIVKNLKPNN